MSGPCINRKPQRPSCLLTDMPACPLVLLSQVGLRPGRASVRLELELLELQQAQQAKQAKRRLPVVHNYGHGGAGLTLAWGCAGDAAALVQQALLGEHAAAAVH